MLKHGRHTWLLLTWLTMLWSVLVHAQAVDEDKGAEIRGVLTAIQESLKEAQINNVSGFPKLKSATMTLQTIATADQGVSFKFLVFSIETKAKTEQASTLTLKLTPPATVDVLGVGGIDPSKLKYALARAIAIAKIGAIEANAGTPKLDLSNVKIQIKFAVTTGAGGGLDIELLPIGVKGTGKLDKNQIHTVELEFGS